MGPTTHGEAPHAIPPGDPYTENILASLPPHVRASFSVEQLAALRTALSRVHDRSRHLLDIRGVVPLYFARFYIVFLFGKDRRRQTREVLLERRRLASNEVQLALLAGAIWAAITLLLVGAFLLLYLLKSAAGIDLFADSHLRDWLRP